MDANTEGIAQASPTLSWWAKKHLLYTFTFLTIWKQNETFWNHITWFNHKTIQPGINTIHWTVSWQARPTHMQPFKIDNQK